MNKSELSDLVYNTTNKSIKANSDIISPVLNSLAQSIRTGNDLDNALFAFFMEAVHMGVTSSIQVLMDHGFLDISS